MRRRIAGMVVVITGASAGIGRQLAIDLHARGAKLTLAARRADKLDELNRQLGGEHLCVAADVSRESDCQRLILAAEERFGRIDTLVANAGYGFPAKVHEGRREQMLEILHTNVLGTLDCARFALPIMLKQPPRDGWRGQVMIVSSAAARRGLPYLGAYSATKAAQLSLAEAMRVELREEGVAVTSVHPIGTETDFFQVAESLGGMRLETSSRRSFRQPVTRVTRAMVRGIERPKREVWTSLPTRVALALNALFPSIGDLIMRQMKRQLEAMNR
ncbi:MAG: SDR family NAD(P)-dependent oxidoreductase [Phycisphaerae bacterium]|nr:SDR family NAD(P)-dependent oxidoreductase [Phycisphaerae bacterium]MDW8261079.1 SDR family NAD(P)-dependent oxidoreductase [Phycisphaerales bacterium]